MPSGLVTPSNGASSIARLNMASTMVEQIVATTSQKTISQPRPGRCPSGKSRKSKVGAANREGIKVHDEIQAITSPPGRPPGSMKSA